MSQFHATMRKYVYYAHDDDDSSYFLCSFFALTFFFALVFSCEWRCRQRCGSLQYLRGSNLQSNRTATVVTWIPTA